MVRRVTATGILFTDHYQLTMAQLYHRQGLHERSSQFDYYFRSYPDYGEHQAGYCIAAGLEPFIHWMTGVEVTDSDISALSGLRGAQGAPIFEEGFLDWLRGSGGYGSVSMRAIPEGRVVHPDVPLAIVDAPLAVAQLLETPLLNQLNFPTLIATKASRVVEATRGGSVLEFGMRRAPGWAANAATRASLIGGADYSSNAGESFALGVPSRGTHAHSMVQVFMAIAGGELEAFRAYAELYPDDCLLLVDTIDTLESGVPNAIKVFEELRAKGHRPVGIRLDSGDLAHLAVRAARMLDDAGFGDVSIALSSQLDELTIFQIRTQIVDEAGQWNVDPDDLLRRLVYGVGSRMTTSHGDPSLDGVYKAVSVDDEAGTGRPAVKISDTPAKIVNPGEKDVWRIYSTRGTATADLIGLRGERPDAGALSLVHPSRPTVRRVLTPDQIGGIEPLLVDVMHQGAVLVDLSELGDVPTARKRRAADLARLDPGVRRLVNPHTYHVSLTEALSELKWNLVADHSA
jgi:nicotinate phosphoribosyltransferase